MYVTSSLLATVLFATVLKLSCTSETIFIKTNNSSDHQCPAEPCLTLQEFVSYHHHVESNTVLKFLPGNHVLLFATSQNISAMDVVNVTLTGVSDQQSSIIYCVSEFSVVAINVHNLTISNLSFFGCGAPVPEQILTAVNITLLYRTVTLSLFQISNINILDTHVSGSNGVGMLAVNAFDFILNRTSFVGNIPNCVLIFKNQNKISDKLDVFTYIANSEFAYGLSFSIDYGSGLSLIFYQTSYIVYVNMTNVALYNNTGIFWGNFLMTVEEWSGKYTMVRAEKIRCNSFLWHPAAGFSVQESSYHSLSHHVEDHSVTLEYTLHVMDSYFDTNMSSIVVGGEQMSKTLKVMFTNTSIICNQEVLVSTAMSISNIPSMVLERVSFTHSKLFSSVDVRNSEITIRDAFLLENEGYGGVVTLWKSKVTFLGDIIFARNYGHRKNSPGALYAYSSTLIFEGNVEFVDNTGNYGGALALYAGSQIVLGRHAHLMLLGNRAKRFGGAIFVENVQYRMLTDYFAISCFYTPADLSSTSMNPRVLLENNTADYAGSALYGGWIDFCEIDDPERLLLPIAPKFDSWFQVNGRQLDHSLISSNPLRVCLCIDSQPECSITHYNISTYPGTTIEFLVVAVGQRLGTVPSTVRSDFIMNGVHPNIKDWQHTQKVGKGCTNLTYTIMSPSQVEITMVMEVENLDTPDRGILRSAGVINKLENLRLYITDLKIHIEMLPCPLGFEYDNTSMMCTCDSKLVENEINCSIDTQTIWRKSSFWITAAEESGGVIVHEHCPFDYCKPESFDLDLEYPDEQCAFHRSGILCGVCQHNLSHVFGTSACRECLSLWALLWVPVIALAGIALVVLLIGLNLTVSVGTINGLIFYANIVRANHATFFPPNTTNSFLSWFIAWINVDLGIETCFYNGLDAYVKTWLQFVFPLYIWFLVIIIIVLSHYSTLAARLSGRNAVQVLATLFLLSYAKLLQVLITAFSSTTITHSDGHQQTVWLYDGNINYLEGKHAVLFTSALLVLLFLSVPYTALLVFTQYIQLKSKYRIFRFWVPKLKPLFDAYTGPYKNKYRYWTGFLLLVRVALFLVFAANVLGDPGINLLVIVICTTGLFVHLSISGGVYKARHLNFLEYFFLFNLTTLSSATLYVRLAGGDQKALIFTSVSASFIIFACIVVCHSAVVIKSTQLWKIIRERLNSRGVSQKVDNTRRERSTTDREGGAAKVEMKPLFLNFNELREPILEYCN